MLVVMRLWRYLALARWSGQAHAIDNILKHRRKGSLAVWCPACPEIGFNVNEDVVSFVAESKT